MTNTYICNAIWAPTGEICDIRVGPGLTQSLPGYEHISIRDAEIHPTGTLSIPAGARCVDAKGKYVLPALYDMHAKAEVPGRSKRESVSRTGQAAAQGGVWGILVMPTSGFMFDNYATLDSFNEAVAQRSAAEMTPTGTISEGAAGSRQAPYNTLAARGVSILTDGDNVPSDLLMLHRAMKYAAELGLTFAIRGDVPAISANTYIHPGTTSYLLGLHGTPTCAEEIGIETLLRLAADAGAKLHLQTVSTAVGVESIRRAKAAGQQVTAEVALHHLLYTHENIGDYDTTYKVIPPLREQSDCEALLAGIKDGTIDCIVTDHTPCTPFDKKQDFITAPQGMTSLDTFLPALYTHLVKPGKLTWEELVRACCATPLTIVNPQNEENEAMESVPLLLFDPEPSYTVTPEMLVCGSQNNPSIGKTLNGIVTLPIQ